jgi:FkbM family methyltransferase
VISLLKRLYRRINPTPEVDLLRALRQRRLGKEPIGVELPSGRIVRGMKPLEAYNEYKDIFFKGIYRFSPVRPNPVILDAGAYVGFSALHFLEVHPNARLILFECDPDILQTLKNNLKGYEERYELVQKALSSENGEQTFFRSGDDGGSMVDDRGEALKVETTTLLPWLENEVDFLKMNIEGSEMATLRACGKSLRKIREMVIEFHSFAEKEQELDHLLTTLKEAGFRYLVNHYDADSNFACEPPFQLNKDTSYVLLVYAKRDDLL